MTQIKLWQIVSQTPNTIVFADATGKLTTIPAGSSDQMLVISDDGTPMWVDNTALATALEAKTDATNAVLTAKAYTEAQIAALVDNAPVALNTLNELAQKLNGEDSAINALLLQVDGKAEKTEVATQVAQAKQDVTATSKAYTDSTLGTAMSGVTAQISQAKTDAMDASATDATFKANTAKTDAIASANGFTTKSIAQAVSTSASDATTKADAARTGAVSDARTYTDGVLASGLAGAATDAQSKADAAKADAIASAATDATAKVSALQNSIPDAFVVEGTSTACYLAASKPISQLAAVEDGLVVTDIFSEVTGADVSDSDTSLVAKLLFINGNAQSEDWTASKNASGSLIVKFSANLAQRVFDGSDNAIMVLAQYKSYNAIALKAA